MSEARSRAPHSRAKLAAVMPRTTILLTGFGPFPGIADNATQHLVPRLAEAARRRFPRHTVHAEILPTEWQAGPHRLVAITEAVQPGIALHFGVSEKATGFVLEARGLNHCRQSPDAAGCLPEAAHVIAGAVHEHATSLAVETALARLAMLGLPASVSNDAGGYLCNAVLYRSLTLHAHTAGAIVGFVHVPAHIGDASNAPLSWPQAERGALEIVVTAVQQQRGRLSQGSR